MFFLAGVRFAEHPGDVETFDESLEVLELGVSATVRTGGWDMCEAQVRILGFGTRGEMEALRDRMNGDHRRTAEVAGSGTARISAERVNGRGDRY